MKIALDIRKIGQQATGDETYITNLVKNLARIDRENKYFLCTDSKESEMKARRILGTLGKNFKLVILAPGGKLSWTRKVLPKFVKKQEIDVVHVQYITPQKLPKEVKLITTIHDISFKKFPHYIGWKDRWILNRFIPRSIKKAWRVIAVSEFTRREILKFFKKQAPPKKVVTIYNGVNEERFKFTDQFSRKYLERIRTKYNLGERYIFHTSSLQPRKNVPALIEAYKEYIRRSKDEKTMLVIGGERGRNYDRKIDEMLQDLTLKQRVKMLGYIKDEDMGAIYALASLYIAPSFYEGFDLPVIEAMKSGVPVLASKGSCHEEVVGEAGLLVDSTDKEKFALKIDAGLNDKKLIRNLMFKGRKQADKFSWEKCARETLKLYQ